MCEDGLRGRRLLVGTEQGTRHPRPTHTLCSASPSPDASPDVSPWPAPTLVLLSGTYYLVNFTDGSVIDALKVHTKGIFTDMKVCKA